MNHRARRSPPTDPTPRSPVSPVFRSWLCPLVSLDLRTRLHVSPQLESQTLVPSDSYDERSSVFSFVEDALPRAGLRAALLQLTGMPAIGAAKHARASAHVGLRLYRIERLPASLCARTAPVQLLPRSAPPLAFCHAMAVELQKAWLRRHAIMAAVDSTTPASNGAAHSAPPTPPRCSDAFARCSAIARPDVCLGGLPLRSGLSAAHVQHLLAHGYAVCDGMVSSACVHALTQQSLAARTAGDHDGMQWEAAAPPHARADASPQCASGGSAVRHRVSDGLSLIHI